jgi:predicted outer membrane protein
LRWPCSPPAHAAGPTDPQIAAIVVTANQVDVDENVAQLKKLSGPEFDKAYVDHEVTYHQAVLDATDQTLAMDSATDETPHVMAALANG